MLQQEDFPDSLYKRIKQDYFTPKRNLIGKPRDSEIAQTAVFYMIRKHLIKDGDALSQLLDLPFFKNNIHNSDIFFDALRLRNPNALVIIEPSKLDELEYVSKIEEEIKQKLIVENQEFFEKQREQYRQEIENMVRQLATIPTKLEKQEYQEPELEEEEEPRQREWWQLLNLKADPFPLAEGLQRISIEMYEHIIVRTDIFRQYVNYAEKLRDQIFKNTIFYGDFGSGKTAFFDYLKEILLRNKVLSVYTQLWPGLEGDTNIYNYEEDLIFRLREECARFGVILTDKDGDRNRQQTIKDILFRLGQQCGFTGFVVFVDDLHKNPKAFDAVIDFLSYLQIFTSSLTKAGNLNVALYVAGIPQWRNRISSESRLSGSLIREENMPVVTEEDAYNMLNKRMLTFSKNTDKTSIIGRGFVKQVYDNLRQTNSSITFRQFLRKALEELRNGNFDNVLTVNPRAIPTNVVHEIRNLIYEKPLLSYQFDELLTRMSEAQAENKQKCFEFLGAIYLEGGISEDSAQAERNLWAFQQLERVGLVHYAQGSNNSIRWFVSKELAGVNRDIIARYHVSMEEYLVPAFVGNPVYRKRNIASPEIEILEKVMKARNKPSEEQVIRDAINLFKPLLTIDRSHTINIDPKELVDKCVASLAALTRTFMFLHNLAPKGGGGSDIDVIQFWKDFYHKPSSLIEFLNQLERKEKLDISRANFIFGLYKDAFTDVVIFLQKQEEMDKIFSLHYEELTEEDCRLLDKVREHWSKREYFVMSLGLNEYLEAKLRLHVHNLFSLLLGGFERRLERLDQKLKDKILDNTTKDQKKGLAKVSNELQYLDRKDYKVLMTCGPANNLSDRGHLNWQEIFSYVFAPWTETELLQFLDQFGDFNTSTAHGKSEAIDVGQQPDLRQFALNAMFFLRKLNNTYRLLITSGVQKVDSKLYFAMNKHANAQQMDEVNVSLEEYKHLVKRMGAMEEIIVPLDDPNFIQTFYNLDFRKFAMVLSLLLSIDEEKAKKVGARLQLVKDRSPNFRLRLLSVPSN